VARRRPRARERADGRGRCSRLQIAGEARETVLFLIRHHSDVARRLPPRHRGPDVVKEFADFVGTEDRLKMLCLITLADVGAVSPTR
jgi:[protein-PII] uridylyltransferase